MPRDEFDSIFPSFQLNRRSTEICTAVVHRAINPVLEIRNATRVSWERWPILKAKGTTIDSLVFSSSSTFRCRSDARRAPAARLISAIRPLRSAAAQRVKSKYDETKFSSSKTFSLGFQDGICLNYVRDASTTIPTPDYYNRFQVRKKFISIEFEGDDRCF